MSKLRKYGVSPFSVVVVHGGPGAGGELAPVARALATDRGVLEPFQTENSINKQLEELRSVIETDGDRPITLLGFSWGAWLSFIFAATYPELVEKLVLISSGPFDERYAEKIFDTRMSRLSEDERSEVVSILKALESPEEALTTSSFEQIGSLFSKADTYDEITHEPAIIEYRPDIFDSVWKEAAEMRRSGRLLQFGKKIKCPVVAIHGDYDSHPAEGVRDTLNDVLTDFEFILLKHCGHTPWLERQARDEFFQLLSELLD